MRSLIPKRIKMRRSIVVESVSLSYTWVRAAYI